VQEWIPKDVERVYAVLDNLTMHRTMDVLFFNLAYPRWEFVFQPTAAAYLNLIEPWWKTRKLAGLQRTTLRELGASRGGSAEGDSLLECSQASLCVGKTPTTSSSQKTWHCASATGGMNLVDAPLSSSFLITPLVPIHSHPSPTSPSAISYSLYDHLHKWIGHSHVRTPVNDDKRRSLYVCLAYTRGKPFMATGPYISLFSFAILLACANLL
jgi:hypothetical protein